MVRFIDFAQPKVEVTLEDPETYRDTQPDLDELIASAETGGGVLVYSIFPTAHETKIEIMHDDPERPLVYVPQSTNRPYWVSSFTRYEAFRTDVSKIYSVQIS